MGSVLVRAINGLAVRRDEPPHVDGAASTSWRVPRWLVVVGFWTVIVLAYSTRTEVRAGTFPAVEHSYAMKTPSAEAASGPGAPAAGSGARASKKPKTGST